LPVNKLYLNVCALVELQEWSTLLEKWSAMNTLVKCHKLLSTFALDEFIDLGLSDS